MPRAIHTPDGTWRVNNNFPKLASSAAHLFGRPKVWAEEGGGLGIDGKFELDFQLVRGVTALQIRVPIMRGPGGPTAVPSATPPPVPPQASMLAWYANRGGYLMAIGRPAAQVGIYHPANSIWMGDDEADRSTTKLGWQLLEHQVDWDYFDEQSLSSVAAIEDGGFKNLSGQVYRAIVVPSTAVITRTGIDRFRAFVKAGGKVIFVGKTPTLLVDNTFLGAKETPDLSFATLIEPSGDITARVLAALPRADVKLDADFPRLAYTHRSWRDADMYLFFNESNQEESRIASIAGRGQAQVWDLTTGDIHPISGVTGESGTVRFPLLLSPYETKVIVVGPMPTGGRCRAAGFRFRYPIAGSVGRLDGRFGREGDEHPTEIVGGAGRAILFRPGYLSQAVHGSDGAAGKTSVSRNRRCPRLRADQSERKGTGRAGMAAVSLGRDQHIEAWLQRSGDTSQRVILGPHELCASTAHASRRRVGCQGTRRCATGVRHVRPGASGDALNISSLGSSRGPRKAYFATSPAI